MVVTTEGRKIFFLVDFFRTINAGTERQLGHLLTHLPDRGYAVRLVSLQESPFLRHEVQALFPKIAVDVLHARADISKSLPALFRLYSLLRRSRPDIVQTFFTAANSFGAVIAKMARVPAVITSRRDMGFNLTGLDMLVLKRANRFVNGVIANSRAVRSRAIEAEGIAPEKVHVIYNGLRFDAPDSPSAAGIRKRGGEKVVGIVANLNRPVKRVDLFIRAAGRLHREHPAASFWVFGDGPLRAGLERLASEQGLDSRLTFWGRRNDVHEFLSGMDIGVICSDSEGLSNAVMEYMAAGLPVVATDVGGNPELVQEGRTGFLVPPDDPAALAGAIGRVLDDPENGRRMGATGASFLRSTFQVENMVQATCRLYDALLSPSAL